ncbi:MAG: DUF3108 domain-containing protein [Ramlibacter sp.]|nr:DUF3108 domain-containing protein [Ramlibacter sp.]
MAGGARLKHARGPLLALLAAVLLLHVLAIHWLAAQLRQGSLLQPLATPMFTRVLSQQAPPAVPVAPPVPAAARAKRAVVASTRPVPAAPQPQPAASEPEPAPAATASAPDERPRPAIEEPAVAAAPAPEPAASAASPAEPAASAPGAAMAGLDSWPADTRLNYRLGGQFRSGELHGSARVQWQREGERYQTRIDIDVTLLASLVLTSQGEVTPQGLFPRVYEELRRSGPRTAKLGEASVVLNDGRSVPRPEGVQDTASQFVELSHRFATGQEALEVGRSVSFWLARPGGVDLWTYDVVGRETLLSTELGAIDAFHLKPRRITNPRGNITAEIWVAPSLQYLPVRIRVSMGDGTYVDLMADRIEQR